MDQKSPDGRFEGSVLHDDVGEWGYAVFGEFLDYSCFYGDVSLLSPRSYIYGSEGRINVRTVNAIPRRWPTADIATSAGRAFDAAE